MRLSERILAAWAEKEWPGQKMKGWADEVVRLEKEKDALREMLRDNDYDDVAIDWAVREFIEESDGQN